LWAACAPGRSAAQTQPPVSAEEPVLFKADSLRHDRELGLIVASGNVEFTRAGETLLADTVSYNERSDVIAASGGVKLMQSDGTVIFADHVELTGDLREGVIRDLRMRLSDNSMVAAAGGRRSAGNRTELNRAVYSPCDLCREAPERAPLWQIKARRVVHDQVAQDMIYNDATLEFFGVPVMYLPYFSHPDPTVERRSGFLPPTFGSDSQLGRFVRVPYYFDIAPDRDATFEPIFPTKQAPVLNGEYRERFAHGATQISGSVTRSEVDTGDTKTRGHLKGSARFDLDPTWRTGAELYRTTDDTYLRRYDFDSTDTLTSRLFVEGFRGRNYAAAHAYAFQGLRATDDPGATPIVAPLMQYHFVDEPGRYGQRWTFDGNLLAITRTDGTDSRRLSLTPGWRLPVTTRSGEVYTLFATVQADAYNVDEAVDPRMPTGARRSGTTGRVFPQAGLDWRYPFVKEYGSVRQILEPTVGFVAAPNGGNPSLVPNEDSLDLELQDTNIFDASRFTGLDRVEGGQRVYYGARTSFVGAGGGMSQFFLGQSYRLRTDDTFPDGSGLEDHLSDIVGRVSVIPSSFLNVLYRFRLDKDDLEPRRHEIATSFGPRALRFGVSYLFIDRQPNVSEFPTREEIQASAVAQLTPHWSAGANLVRDLTESGGQLRHGFAVVYEDECFIFTSSYTRTFTIDRDLQPSDTIYFRLALKNLGEFRF
jgi:LPS-assembly protein